ncbi:NADPH oxidase [Acrasis kona]|uniref:NADPH oxidase n=1 Tax=Acrasis kona TaxID=1008807 RepID=A0AAW2ZE38_9EUKA
MAAIVMVVFHAIWSQTVPFISTSVGLYVIDLLMRAVLGYMMPAKLVSVRYLGDCGITRLVIHKPGFKYKPGQWIYLYISSVGLLDSQPFTISGHTQDPEMQEYITVFVKNMAHSRPRDVIGSKWSERLALWARKVGDEQAHISDPIVRVEGPYGDVSHDYGEYDTVVLIAGGVGITAMYSLFISLLEGYRCGEPCCSMKKVYLIWIKKSSSMWDMFPDLLKYESVDNELDILNKNHCEIKLYVTENVRASGYEVANGFQVYNKRPDFRELLRDIARERRQRANDQSKYISVCACGPESMMNDVQGACWRENNQKNRFHFHKELFEL